MEACLICTNNIIDKTKSIFDIDDENKIKIKDILFDLDYKICIEKTGSNSICYDCYGELLKIYKFRDECCILFDCEENFVGCCQLCLAETDEFKSLNDSVLINDESLTVLDILNKICSYDLSIKYDGEEYLCTVCFKTCLENYPFYLKCEKSIEYWNNFILNKKFRRDSCIDFNITEENSAIVQTDGEQSESYEIDAVDNFEPNIESVKTLYECYTCSKKYSKKSYLVNHIRDSHGKETDKFSCKICKRTYLTKRYLKAHMRKAHFSILHCNEKTFMCEKCNKMYLLKRYLDEHMRKAHQRSEKIFHTFMCEKCSKTFHRRQYLNIHMKVVHHDEKLYKCDFCPKSFAVKEYLKRHKLRHNTEKSYMCEICSKTFVMQRYLKSHLLSHIEECLFECDVCLKKFKYERLLTLHKRTHSDVRPYKCDLCEKRFKTKTHLTEHKARHNTERKFKCPICPKAFTTESCLRGHKKTHSSIRSHKCELCLKEFKSSMALKFHIQKEICQKEVGGDPFICEICSKEFKGLPALKIHQSVVHLSDEKTVNNGPFKCDICQKEYKLLRILKIHMGMAHGKKNN